MDVERRGASADPSRFNCDRARLAASSRANRSFDRTHRPLFLPVSSRRRGALRNSRACRNLSSTSVRERTNRASRARAAVRSSAPFPPLTPAPSSVLVLVFSPVTCNFVQKTGGGMHTASTALWDAAVDGKHTVLWESQTIQCIATVYWLAI